MLCQFGYFWQLLVTLTTLFLLSYMSIVIIFSLQYPDRYVEIVKTGMTCIRCIFNICYEKEEESNQIVISDCKQYYTYNGVHYDIAFPLFWVLFEHPKRGPHNCSNCSEYGSLRGVFIMYCMNCAEEYNEEGYHVGYGSEGNGVEIITGDLYKSAYMTYLQYRELACVGLPEEKEKAELNREGYEYVICEDYDQDGDVTKMYPDFKQIVHEDDDEEDEEDENEDEDDDDDDDDQENEYDVLLEYEYNRDI